MNARNALSLTGRGAAISAALCLALSGAAAAQQSVPSYGTVPAVPSYGTPVTHQEAIKGTLISFDGAYVVYMRDVRGYDDHISLHQGTVINPTGIKLVEGMQATIYGNANGPTFEAYRIDVTGPQDGGSYYPSTSYGDGYGSGYGSDPGYGYGYGSGYGYPGYYGGAYPWGLSIGLGWGWGWGGWPYGWGGYYGGYPYGWGWGGYYGGGYYGGYRGRYPYRGGYPGRYPGGHGTIQGSPPGRGHGGVSGGSGGHAPVSRPPRR